ncbi:MAG: hypothetical protein ACRED3_18625, partial [Bradyrhizobium sp.]
AGSGGNFFDRFDTMPRSRREPPAGLRSAFLPQRTPEPGKEDEGAVEDGSAIADLAGYEGANALYHGSYLRSEYQRRDAALAEAVRKLIGALPGDLPKEELDVFKSQIARAGVAARNAIRADIRRMGEPIVTAVAKALRGKADMPTYKARRDAVLLEILGPKYQPGDYVSLENSMMADDAIIAKFAKTNARANLGAVALKGFGLAGLAADAGLGMYRVAHAPDDKKVATAVEETRRVGGGLAGGIAGAKAGAALGAGIGLFFPPAEPWTIGIGSLAGGALGAIYGADYLGKPWW